MSKIRNSARGEECTLQLYPHCSGDPATVVLCHVGRSGMGMKSNDWESCYGCHNCHAVIDGKEKTEIPTDELSRLVMWAVFRTWVRMIEKGLIKIQGVAA